MSRPNLPPLFRRWRAVLHRSRAALPAAALLLATACGLERGATLEEFEWQQMSWDETIQGEVEASAMLGQIMVLGHTNTPSACSDLRPQFTSSGDRLTLRVVIHSVFTGCATEGEGAYQYQGVVRRLRTGTYQFTVVHTFPGTPRADEHFIIPLLSP
jgi:hypothetical protein